MTRTRRNRVFCLTAMASVVAAGCRTAPLGPLFQPTPDAKRWPPPPASPRIQHLGSLTSADQVAAPRTDLWTLIVGEERKPEDKLVAPIAVAVSPDDRVFVADTDIHAVHLFDLTSRTHEIIGQNVLDLPSAICWGAGRLYIADAKQGAIYAWTPATGLRRLGTESLDRPAGLAWSDELARLFVSNLPDGTIHVLDESGRTVETWRPSSTNLAAPTHMAYHASTGLIVADTMQSRLARFDASGTPLNTIGTPGDAPGNLALPKGVACDSAGHIYVVDARFESVQAFNAEGQLLIAFGSEGTGDGEFWLPSGMCIDDRDRIWIADTYNSRIQAFQYIGERIDPEGISQSEGISQNEGSNHADKTNE